MKDSVNPNYISLFSAGFAFLINPNESNNDIYIGILSNILEFPYKGILSAKQVRVSGHFYGNKPRKLGGKQRLVITDGRVSRMFISDGLSYLHVKFSTDEEMDSYPKLPLTQAG